MSGNDGVMNSLVVKGGGVVKEVCGCCLVRGYERGKSKDVGLEIGGVFGGMDEIGIVYGSVGGSYEDVGEGISMGDEVIGRKIGKWIEVRVVMGCVLEGIGMKCVVIVEKGDGYVGVWVVDECYCCRICDDG